VTATVDAHFIGQISSSALAGISLVFPLIMLMQQMANSSMGGAIASAIARAIGAGRHADAPHSSFMGWSSPLQWPRFSRRSC
jgi:Na+-driven multidrug efflux pump